MLNKLPKAVLFDFDGVVVNSFNVHGAAWSKAFQEIFGMETPPFPIETHEGKSPMEIAKYFCGTQNRINEAQKLYNLKGKYLHSNDTPPELLPGIHEITEFLTSNKIPFGIASNATKQFIKNSIQQLNIDFPIYTGFEDYTFPKPHPEAYSTLAKNLGFEEKEFHKVWVLEDSVTGLTAAKSAQMVPIGIQTKNSAEKLASAGAIASFKHVQEVFNFLQKL
jgi:beta-phosphoglucomutase